MGDSTVAPMWLGATLLLVWAAWRVGEQLFPHDALGPRLMHTLVLSWACIVGVATILGSVGWLSSGFMLAAVSAGAGLAWWCVTSTSGSFRESSLKTQSSTNQTAGRERFADQSVPENRPRFYQVWLALWGGVSAWAISWTVWKGLLEFPDDWDTLNYHLPLIVQWLHRGNLYAPDDAIWFAPGNNELLGLWLVGPFSGDFLIALINLPSVLLLAASTVELARNLGVTRSWQHLTALATLATWPVLRQLTDAENDVAVVGLFTAVLAYGIRYARQGRRANLALAAVSLGLLAGVKYYALGYACVAGLGLALLMLAMRGLREFGKVASVLTLGVCLWGSYWYIRNICIAVSPIYPQGFSATNDPLRHIRTSTGQSPVWQTTLLGNGQPEVLPLLCQAVWSMTGPCHVAACLLLPLTLAWLAASGIWRCFHGERSGFTRLTLTFWLVASSMVWGVTPFAAEVVTGTLGSVRSGYHPIRYGLCFLSLCILGLVLVIDDLSQVMRRLLRFAFAGPPNDTLASSSSIRYSTKGNLDAVLIYLIPVVSAGVVVYQYYAILQGHIHVDLLDLLCLAANLWLTGGIVLIAVPRSRRVLTATLIVGLIGVSLAVTWLGDRWHASFTAHYNPTYGFQLSTISESMNPSTTCICTMTYRYYPFFGSRRQFRVCRPYWVPSYESLLEYLHKHEATLVVALHSDPGGVRRYDDKSGWLRAHPELFPPLEDGALYFVCRVDRYRLANVLETK